MKHRDKRKGGNSGIVRKTGLDKLKGDMWLREKGRGGRETKGAGNRKQESKWGNRRVKGVWNG